MLSILAYITDLFFQAKVGQSAQSAGVDLKIVSSLYKFLPELASKPSLILLDLNADGISASSLIAQIRARDPGVRIVAYGSHVQSELLERARQAGADEILSRSQLSKDLLALLTRLSDQQGST